VLCTTRFFPSTYSGGFPEGRKVSSRFYGRQCGIDIDIYRYANVDYSVSEAFKQCKGQRVVFTYDINCQYSRNFEQRFGKNGEYLQLPDVLEIVNGIGKYHLPGHKKDCYYEYSLNFLRHVARLDGERIESLWAILGLAALSTKEMSIGARVDALNQAFNYSNFKKLVGMRKYCCTLLLRIMYNDDTAVYLAKSYRKAVQSLADTAASFDAFHSRFDTTTTADWARLEEEALSKGGKALEIYKFKGEEGKSTLPF